LFSYCEEIARKTPLSHLYAGQQLKGTEKKLYYRVLICVRR